MLWLFCLSPFPLLHASPCCVTSTAHTHTHTSTTNIDFPYVPNDLLIPPFYAWISE